MRGAGAVAFVAAAAVAGGCAGGGGGDRAGEPLAWQGSPKAFRPASLPNDRIVLAAVRNTSDRSLNLQASKLVVRDGDGSVLPSSAQFVAGYAHGLYGAFQKPNPLPPDELRRLGLVITLAPGATAPLTVAWRLGKGSREPASVDYGEGRLRLPVGAASTGT